ncbi:MAG: hypothetical protein CMJ46_00465 [Planctomyces sp.]|nr:hypothetical protein [Planctomyces sp.]
MIRSLFCMGFIAVFVIAGAAESTFARGFGGGGNRGGGGGGHIGGGGGGGHSSGGGNRGGGGGFSGGVNRGGGGGFSSGGGLSGGGYRPSRPTPSTRPSVQPGGGGGIQNSGNNVVHRPPSPGSNLGSGSRPQINPGNSATRPTTRPATRPDIPAPGGNRPNIDRPNVDRPNIDRPNVDRPTVRPGGDGRPNLPGGDGNRPDGLRPGGNTRPGADNGLLPGLGSNRPGNNDGRLPTIRPGQDGGGSRLPGLSGGDGNRPALRPGEGGDGGRWTPGDRDSIPGRHDDLANRFDDLNSHWGDREWANNEWNINRDTNINNFGYWGPSGYWGHSGAWGHGGFYGPVGHWSRPWGWYNGFCPTWGHCRWDYLWNRYPAAMAVGATMWGINAVNWMFGVGDYYNPYYTQPVYVQNQPVAVYDQPIIGNLSDDATASDDSTSASTDPLTDTFDQARQAFYDGDYDNALSLTNQALAKAPRDAAINEFRSLCLFALGQYQDSAATIHAVLAAGPGWDWTTLISMYQDPATYTQHLQRLEDITKASSPDASSFFLLGYHYLTAGHQDEALTCWQKVVSLNPDDKLAAQFVQMYSPAPDSSSTAPTSPPENMEQPAYPLDQLEGTWTTSNDNGEYTLKLNTDDSFNWTYSKDGQSQDSSGAFIVRGNNLVMQPDAGGTLISTINLKNVNTLEFTPIGEATSLTFTK